MTTHSDGAVAPPCKGLKVVELALGTSDLGLGLAGGLPGMMLTALGANVVRVVDASPAEIDRDVAWGYALHRDKELVKGPSLDQIRQLLSTADVALVYGSLERIEQAGLGYADLAQSYPALVYARCRPSHTGQGTVPDYGLLVEAQAGFCSQLQGHRAGPIFVDVRASGAGAAFVLLTSVLALLRQRELTGQGGWSETSLYDGMLATLGTMIGRSEQAPEHVESYWEKGSTFPNFMYRCADDELLQVWFGGKGMYDKLIQVLGDEPSGDGYYSDQVSGALNARAVRWRDMFAAQPRQVWIERLRAAGVACEPVLAPGDALSDPHLAEIGLAREYTPPAASSQGTGASRYTLVGSAIAVTPSASEPQPAKQAAPPPHSRYPSGKGLLAGLRVLDFSAFVAGPLTAQVLADLGADVIKVEPPQGEAMRAAAYALAACQRGKRSLAMDITAAPTRPVVERLIGWADVVLHNFRVGVSSRLGIDEATVARINPRAVYCHASAFGATGPRAKLPGNDALMQALTGFERAVGGADNEPIAATWIPIDMTGGWVGAVGVLAGLYAQARQQQGQFVATSLLGAGMLLQSGVYQRDGAVVWQPRLDSAQTGYGPGYRLYACADDHWLALVVPDNDSWQALRALPEFEALPQAYLPLRRSTDDSAAQAAEQVIASALATAPASAWAERFTAQGLLCQVAAPMDRDQFRRRIIDDPVNQQLGRVIAYQALSWGKFEQIGSLLRTGPQIDKNHTPQPTLPQIGEHSVAVLQELGFEQTQINELLEAKLIRQF